MAGGLAGGGIESFTFQASTVLDFVGQIHDTGEGVGEVQTEEASDKVGEGAKLGHRHAEDKSKDPVHGSETPPEQLALLGGDGGEVEDGLADFEVDSLHADVEVED